MSDTATFKALRAMFEEIRDERRMAQNTATRIGNAFLALLSGIVDDSPFLRKDEDADINAVFTFLKGLKIGDDGDFYIDADGKAKLKQLITEAIEAGEIRTDYLTVTKSAHFFQLVIDKMRSQSGTLINTAANCTIDKVQELTDDGGALTGWRCYFRASDADGRAISNEWQAQDQAICYTCNLAEGTTYNASNRYWWRLVTATGTEDTDIDGETYSCHYIDVSATTQDDGSATPQADDAVSQLGNRSDTTRQGAIILAAYATPDKELTSPSFAQYSGITSFDLASARYSWLAMNGNQIRGDMKMTSGEDFAVYVHYAYANTLTPTSTSTADGEEWTKGDAGGKDWTYTGVVADHKSGDTHLGFSDYSWQKTKGDAAVYVIITTDKGNTLHNSQGSITMTANVYRGSEPITNLTDNQFSWTRTSSYTDLDTAWNSRHEGAGPTITVTAEDVIDRSQFDCIVTMNT